jgi:hypothetical protein
MENDGLEDDTYGVKRKEKGVCGGEILPRELGQIFGWAGGQILDILVA